jgi:UDPglucose 6-dehydrogenase
MNIVVIGTGYVGLVTGACFAEMGFNVTCVDKDKTKIDDLRKGNIPIFEPGLQPLVVENSRLGRLQFVESIADAPRSRNTVYFIAVGTPPDEDGSADLSHVLTVAREIGEVIDDYSVVVDKSTVPVGTAERVREAVQETLTGRGAKVEFDVVSNPEFLKEGSAIEDTMRPDRVVIGADSERAKKLMHEIYAPYTRNHECTIFMGVCEAEMTKYAANAMLATKISFMNEIANLCDALGVDVESVRLGIGSDTRIGYDFIYPGAGYGGSCFPKDVKALIKTAEEIGVDAILLKSVEDRNERQKSFLYNKIANKYGLDLKGKRFGLWGLAFKPGTDDMREAPSLVVLQQLLESGAHVTVYDPVAMAEAKRVTPPEWFAGGKLQFADDQYQVADNADALILITEWKPFRHPDFERLKSLMNGHTIFDGRNQYDPADMKRLGFDYYGIGR